jgi:hypothetical protein
MNRLALVPRIYELGGALPRSLDGLDRLPSPVARLISLENFVDWSGFRVGVNVKVIVWV